MFTAFTYYQKRLFFKQKQTHYEKTNDQHYTADCDNLYC